MPRLGDMVVVVDGTDWTALGQRGVVVELNANPSGQLVIKTPDGKFFYVYPQHVRKV